MTLTQEEIAGYFAKGIDCGQVTLIALSEALGVDRETAQRLSAGFGAGMFDGKICGAYLAGICAIGLKYGHTEEMEDAAREAAKGKTVAAVLSYQHLFEERFGGCVCEKLLGYKLPEEMQAAIESGHMMSYCPKLVQENLALLQEIFAKN